MLKKEEIKQYLNDNRITFNENCYILASAYSIDNVEVYSKLQKDNVMKLNIIHFSNEGIAIIGVNEKTWKIVNSYFIYIPKIEVKDVVFKKKVFSYDLSIITERGVNNYKVTKKISGLHWHNINLKNLVKLFNRES